MEQVVQRGPFNRVFNIVRDRNTLIEIKLIILPMGSLLAGGCMRL